MNKTIFKLLIKSIYLFTASSQEIFEAVSDQYIQSFLENKPVSGRFGSKETILIHNNDKGIMHKLVELKDN
jgi:hypothetical protein